MATPTTGSHSNHEQTPAATGLPSAHPNPSLPDEAVVSSLRSLPGEERSRRLIQAAYHGAEQEVRELLAAGADLEARQKIRERWTPLLCAAAMGHLEVVQCLLLAGADVGVKDRRQRTPLHMAALNGHTAVVRLLLAEWFADPNTREYCSWTPLHWAAYYGYADVATVLLESGADQRAEDKDGNTPLDIARVHNHGLLISILQ